MTSACKSHKVLSTPFRVTTTVPAPEPKSAFVGIATTSDGQGYWVVRADGAVLSYGDAEPLTSLPAGAVSAGAPIVAMARTYDGHGAWLVNSEGHVYELGDARSYGSLSSSKAAQAPITSMASTPDGRGYWLLAANGQVYGFGDAHLQGMPNSYSAPYDAIVARPAGGYIITGADDAENYAYPGGLVLGGGPGYTMSATLVGGASTPSGNGTWLTGRDGGVYSFGTGTGSAAVTFYGSVPGDQRHPQSAHHGHGCQPRRRWLLARRRRRDHLRLRRRSLLRRPGFALSTGSFSAWVTGFLGVVPGLSRRDRCF